MPASYPKPDGQKVTRHKPRFDWTDLPAAHDIEAPPLPEWRIWDLRSLAWWAELWSKPQAVMWPPDGSSLFVLATLADDLITGRANARDVSGEIRQHEDRHGLTPKAMMQLRWRYAEGPDDEHVPAAARPKSTGTSASMRARLSVVPDEGARTRFECSVCGKLTAGRRPRGGDGSMMYPRRHSIEGNVCAGSFIDAAWVVE